MRNLSFYFSGKIFKLKSILTRGFEFDLQLKSCGFESRLFQIGIAVKAMQGSIQIPKSSLIELHKIYKDFRIIPMTKLK